MLKKLATILKKTLLLLVVPTMLFVSACRTRSPAEQLNLIEWSTVQAPKELFRYEVFENSDEKFVRIYGFNDEFYLDKYAEIEDERSRFIHSYAELFYRPMNEEQKVLKDFDVNETSSRPGFSNKTFLNIPEYIDNYPVREIANYAFAGKDINYLSIPGSVYIVGAGSFKQVMLEKLILGWGIRVLGFESFAFNSISDLLIPDSISYILNPFDSISNEEILDIVDKGEIDYERNVAMHLQYSTIAHLQSALTLSSFFSNLSSRWRLWNDFYFIGSVETDLLKHYTFYQAGFDYIYYSNRVEIMDGKNVDSQFDFPKSWISNRLSYSWSHLSNVNFYSGSHTISLGDHKTFLLNYYSLNFSSVDDVDVLISGFNSITSTSFEIPDYFEHINIRNSYYESGVTYERVFLSFYNVVIGDLKLPGNLVSIRASSFNYGKVKYLSFENNHKLVDINSAFNEIDLEELRFPMFSELTNPLVLTIHNSFSRNKLSQIDFEKLHIKYAIQIDIYYSRRFTPSFSENVLPLKIYFSPQIIKVGIAFQNSNIVETNLKNFTPATYSGWYEIGAFKNNPAISSHRPNWWPESEWLA